VVADQWVVMRLQCHQAHPLQEHFQCNLVVEQKHHDQSEHNHLEDHRHKDVYQLLPETDSVFLFLDTDVDGILGLGTILKVVSFIRGLIMK
jgi:hypothetical protein